jgi:hypothetical protein
MSNVNMLWRVLVEAVVPRTQISSGCFVLRWFSGMKNAQLARYTCS